MYSPYWSRSETTVARCLSLFSVNVVLGGFRSCAHLFVILTFEWTLKMRRAFEKEYSLETEYQKTVEFATLMQ
jgi:hypothetical protein